MKPRADRGKGPTSLIDKLRGGKGGGPVTFTGEEVGRLLAEFED